MVTWVSISLEPVNPVDDSDVHLIWKQYFSPSTFTFDKLRNKYFCFIWTSSRCWRQRETRNSCHHACLSLRWLTSWWLINASFHVTHFTINISSNFVSLFNSTCSLILSSCESFFSQLYWLSSLSVPKVSILCEKLSKTVSSSLLPGQLSGVLFNVGDTLDKILGSQGPRPIFGGEMIKLEDGRTAVITDEQETSSRFPRFGGLLSGLLGLRSLRYNDHVMQSFDSVPPVPSQVNASLAFNWSHSIYFSFASLSTSPENDFNNLHFIQIAHDARSVCFHETSSQKWSALLNKDDHLQSNWVNARRSQ